ncbi:hypothetical protein [Cupriavidus pauculus]|uniref:hypothetical protein n=1 Tax=Cupriavidus pauculus TaxID=82633 RepID=UPI001EE18374|nr:hypothetical protein [Cupriavidus pauculus]GJG98177.1 hypothetical protein CBA19C6_26830 [Cupriavidus pauculus]
MRVRVYREDIGVAMRGGARWGYEVCVEEAQQGTRVWGPLHSVAPYGSHDGAQHAGVQRGRLAIDLLLGLLQASWRGPGSR